MLRGSDTRLHLAALHCCRQVDVVMAGWPSAAHDRLPGDVPRAPHGRPGVPRRPLAVGARRMGWVHSTRRPGSGPLARRWRRGGRRSGLAGGSRGAMREQPGDDLDRHAAACRSTIHTGLGGVCHRCFTRLTGQGLTKNQIAATPQCQYPWPGGLHRSGPRRRARAPGRRGRGQMPGSAGERRDRGRRRARARRPPAWRAPGGPRHGPCRTCRWWPPSTTRCPGRPATTRRGPGMRHGGSTWSSPTGRRPAPGRRGSAWTTAGCVTGARRWKACPPRRCRDSPRRG